MDAMGWSIWTCSHHFFFLELAQAFHADVVKIADFYIAVYDYYRLIYLLGTMQTSLISVADGLTCK